MTAQQLHLNGVDALVAGVNAWCQRCSDWLKGWCGGFAGGELRPTCCDEAEALPGTLDAHGDAVACGDISNFKSQISNESPQSEMEHGQGLPSPAAQVPERSQVPPRLRPSALQPGVTVLDADRLIRDCEGLRRVPA